MERHVNLLHMQDPRDSSINHFAWIKNLSRLVSSQLSKKKNKKFFLLRPLNECAVELPKEDAKWLTFSKHGNKERVPFVVYADLECVLEKMDPNLPESQHHKVHSIGYYVHCSYDDALSMYRCRRDKDCVAWFVEELKELAHKVKSALSVNVPMRKTPRKTKEVSSNDRESESETVTNVDSPSIDNAIAITSEKNGMTPSISSYTPFSRRVAIEEKQDANPDTSMTENREETRTTSASELDAAILNALFEKINALEARIENSVSVVQEKTNTEPKSVVGNIATKQRQADDAVVLAKRDTVPENEWTIRMPRGGWLQNPFQDITYSGKRDIQNPIRFLHKFEKTATYERVSDADKLHFFAKAMRGAASLWFELNQPDTFEEAVKSFKENFWSDKDQNKFREELYTTRYAYKADNKENMSMADYALSLARQAKTLDPPMLESEIIRE
ncbi:PREDICTED: uncharacterized protein LOC105450356 [Wasmannia auropunctata]|uniref:uncharacterized protein LOC105450356 n=1 Tax=Wasmannia auropunctata TaxID=64793 RepID=UPI0005EEDC31|nr:PREDICTED: uncharacterized protein LOC105450356 [Wasmannia auropunctata]